MAIETINTGNNVPNTDTLRDGFDKVNSNFVETERMIDAIDKNSIGLGNVDNTSDANKPVSTAQQTEIDTKQNTLTLTTTGTSGAATLVGDTLNIPQYSGGGGGGLKGIHSLIPLKSGDVTNTVMISVNPLSNTAFTTNRLVAYPFIPNQDFTSSDLFVNVNTLGVGSFCRIAVYSDLNGYPNTLLFVSSDLNCSTTGKKTALATINFVAGTTYWLAFHGGAVASSLSCILQAQSMPIKSNTVASMANSYFYALAFTTPTPATFLANQSAISQNLQYIGITKA
jgi:hypothetical protein